MPSFKCAKCADLGMNCALEVSVENKDELMEILKGHASRVHNKTVTPDMARQIEEVMKY